MSSTATATPPSLLLRATSGSRSIIRRGTCNHLSILNSPYSFLRSGNPTRFLRLSASLTENYASWMSPGRADDDDRAGGCNGWAVVERPLPRSSSQKGFSTISIGGGACVAAVVAAVAYFSLSSKGFKLQFRNPLSGLVRQIDSIDDRIEPSTHEKASSDSVLPEAAEEVLTSVSSQKLEQIKMSVLVDSTQLEALSVLKKLQIIEDDVRADELCTRREYARWLVRLNSLLERNSKHRIAYLSHSGSVVAAFDDVGIEDLDFGSIQTLAEAGIVPSKISDNNFCSSSSEGDGSFSFHPGRFISRQDLINWKAQLEYEFSLGMTKQMSKTKVDYMDVKDISSDVSPEFFIDLLAGDKSLIRKVFGKSRRFQPNKPLTKAQAAVVLTSGRMSEAVYNELLRLEAENSSREAELKEIRSELFEKGDIERFWVGKMNEERTRGLEVQKLYISVLHDLEQEKTIEAKALADLLKEKAAMDCQRQLLFNLKEEVDEMSKILASERALYVDEQCNLQDLLGELQTKQEGTLDKKSILEAEIEALRILRSWVEDEAKKSQARAKVLEEVGRRWKSDNQG